MNFRVIAACLCMLLGGSAGCESPTAQMRALGEASASAVAATNAVTLEVLE